jgi:hypothetical protein
VPAPTALFRKFPLGHRSQQLGHIDEVGLTDRQLFGAVSDFCTDPDGPRWKISLRHWAPPFMQLTAREAGRSIKRTKSYFGADRA